MQHQPVFIHFKTIALKQILLITFFLASFLFSNAQVPNTKAQQDEMKQMIAELKKEIATLEAEIRQAEKEDPESVTSLKTQLNTYKNMLAAFDKQSVAAAKPKTANPTVKKPLPQTASPIVKAYLKAPVVAPTPAQANDRFFWYKGKKINDSTLVTTKKTVVQYSGKKQMLIIEPDEKKDTAFVSIAKRIAKGEQAKKELIDQFDQMKNGFIYYPYLENSLVIYDDLTKLFSQAVNNTFTFTDPLPNITAPKKSNNPGKTGKGPNHFVAGLFSQDELLLDSVPDADQLLKQLEDVLDNAEKKMKQLPSIENFSAPPRHELGRCSTCDTSAVSRQAQIDAAWVENYFEDNRKIIQPVLSAARTAALLLGKDGHGIQDRATTILMAIMKRANEKNKILWKRYGNQIHYLPAIVRVILALERQRQLLGIEETDFPLSELMGTCLKVYDTYYKEQLAAKNHDFILNVPFHLGFYRQLALLGSESNGFGVYFNEMLAYNRFSLTIEMDFVWQMDRDGKLERRATGNLSSPKDEVYITLFPDNCGYRMMLYTTDLDNKKWGDVSVPMKVNSGIKTVREEDDKLKDYPYTGAAQYSFRFPDGKINFCDNGPDTLFLFMMAGDEQVAARAQGDIQSIHKTYTIEMLIFAMQALVNEDTEGMMQGTQDAGAQIMNTVAGFMQQPPAENTLDKLKTEYTGYMQMDNQSKLFENSVATKSARIVFNAANRSTVLTDTYIDTKRKMSEDIEIKKGLFHLRMVHEPKGK